MLQISPDGNVLAVAQTGADESPDIVHLIDLRTGETRTLDAFPDQTYSLSFSPDSKLLVASAYDKVLASMVKIWDVGSGKQLRYLTPKEFDMGYPVVFSAGGAMLYAAKVNAVWAYDLADLLDDLRLEETDRCEAEVSRWEPVNAEEDVAIFIHPGGVRLSR